MTELLTPSQAEALSDDKNRLKNHVQSIIKTLENGFEGFMEDNEYGETQTAFDYLQDALDIEYIVSSKKEYLGARVLVAFGGPNIWVNTRTQQVEGYWWGDSCVMSYDKDEMDIDGALSELYNC
jgi:hypothetical protein